MTLIDPAVPDTATRHYHALVSDTGAALVRCGSPSACDPELALELRALYAAVRPGYHQNKRHWNTVDLDGSVEDDELREMIDHSYELVIDRLPRAERARLQGK